MEGKLHDRLVFKFYESSRYLLKNWVAANISNKSFSNTFNVSDFRISRIYPVSQG